MGAAARLANRVLERESWARARLAEHAGRQVKIVVGPLATTLAVDPGGWLEEVASASSAADVTLSIAPWNLPTLATDPARWDELVAAVGDSRFAATLRELAQTSPLWIEQLLARGLGPIVGLRAAHWGRALLAFPEAFAQRFADTTLVYLRDEAEVLARGDDARQLARDAAGLAARTEHLAARVEALAARLSAPTAASV